MTELGNSDIQPPRDSIDRVVRVIRRLTALVTAVGGLVFAVSALLQWIPGIPAWAPVLAAIVLLVLSFLCWPRRSSRLLNPDALRLDPDKPEHLLGRADDIGRLVTVVRENKLTFLVGESGAGKSALVRSGLCPELRKAKELLPIYLDTWGMDWEAGPRRTLCDAAYQALSDDEREEIDLAKRPDPDEVIGFIDQLDDRLGRTPLVIFDQFDDYQTRHRKKFITGKNRTFRKTRSLIQANQFWSDINALLAGGKIHCLFVTRADTAVGLKSVELVDEESTETIPLDRPKTTIVDTLLTELTKPKLGGSPVVSDPEYGWNRLMRRLARDLDTESLVLPIQMKLAFQALGDLPRKILTVRNYEKVGGRTGLEALHIQRHISSSARTLLGGTLSEAQIRTMLLKLIDREEDPPKTVPKSVAELHESVGADDCSMDAVKNTIDELVQRKLLRRRIDTDTGDDVYQLDHDYLGSAVLEAERRADKWPTAMRDAHQAFKDVGDHVWRRYKALLTLRQQFRMLVERLRGRLRYGEARGFAAFSLVRFMPYLLLITVALVGWRIYENEMRKKAEYDIAEKISRKIHGRYGHPAPDEFAALNELATWEASQGELATGSGVRLSFIKQLVTEKDKAKSFRARLPWILHAVVGLDTEMRDEVMKIILDQAVSSTNEPSSYVTIAELGALLDSADADFNKRIAENYVAALENTTDSRALSSLGSALGSLGEKLPAEQAAAGAQQIWASMKTTTDPSALSSLASALGSLGEKLPAEQAAAGAQQIWASMKTTTDPSALSSLASALGSLGEKLPAEQAAALAQQILAAMKTATDLSALSSLGIAFGNLGEKLPPERATALARQILAVMEKTTNPDALPFLGSALGSLGEKLPAEQAAALAQQILAAMEKATDLSALSSLGSALGSLGEKLPAEQAAALAQQILAAMERSNDPHAFASLVRALGSFGEKLPADQAAAGTQQILAAIDKTTDPHAFASLFRALGSLGEKKLPAEQAAAAAHKILAAMDTTTDPHAFASLGRALGSLGEKLPAEQAVAAAQQILATIERATHPGGLYSLGLALGSLVEKLPAEQAAALAQKILAAIERATDRNVLVSLGRALGATHPGALYSLGRPLGRLVEKLPAEQAVALAQQILAAMEKATDLSALSSLGRLVARLKLATLGSALSSLGEKLPAEQAAAFAQQILVAMERTTDYSALSSLGSALGSLVEELPAEQAAALVQQILVAMERTTDYRALSSLGSALGSFAENLPPEHAAALAQQIATVMDTTTNRYVLRSLGNALGSFGEKLPAERAAALAQQILAAMERTTDYGTLSSLGSALGSLGEKLPAEQAAVGAQQIWASMKTTTDPSALSSLASALGSLGEKLPADQAAAGAQQILAAMEKSNDPHAVALLDSALGSLVMQMEAVDVMSVLKSVACVGNVRSEVLNALETKADQKFKGNIWKAVDWAEKLGVHVEKVPRWPWRSQN